MRTYQNILSSSLLGKVLILSPLYPLCFIFLNPLLHISKTLPLVQLLAIHLASRTLLILAISTPSDTCFMQHFHWHIITSAFGIIPISGISLFIPFSPDLWEGMTGATWFPQQSAALLRCGLHLCCWWSPFLHAWVGDIVKSVQHFLVECDVNLLKLSAWGNQCIFFFFVLYCNGVRGHAVLMIQHSEWKQQRYR